MSVADQFETALFLDIHPQPDDLSCGPTCLHAVYRYYGDDVELKQVIAETPRLEDGGTLAVLLACHALRRGYQATIYTYNLDLFDPTWFSPVAVKDLADRLTEQAKQKKTKRIATATASYLEFLRLGGEMKHEDLTSRLVNRYLNRAIPILTGLSATYLYQCSRERYEEAVSHQDDIRGEPAGHFVVVCGYDKATGKALVADPLSTNPVSESQHYSVQMTRLLGAILLGVVTYDANLLIITPGGGEDESGAGKRMGGGDADADRGR